MKREKKRRKRKKKTNIDAYGPSTPDTEKIDELDKKKKAKKRVAYTSPLKGQACEKILKKRKRRKELCGTKRTLEKSV